MLADLDSAAGSAQRLCGGPTFHLRDVTLWSHGWTPLVRLVNPSFLGEPFVIGLADWAVSAREEHHTASKAFAIRFDVRRDRASCLRTFDHDYAHVVPPCFFFVFLSQCFMFASRWIARPGELAPADPECLSCIFDSGDFLHDPNDALLDRLGGLGRDFLGEVPKFLILHGRRIEVLTGLRR